MKIRVPEAAAFERISRSSLSLRFSRRNRGSSSRSAEVNPPSPWPASRLACSSHNPIVQGVGPNSFDNDEKCRAEHGPQACGRLGVTGTGDAGHRKPLGAFLGDAHETRGFLGFDSTSVASIDVGGVRFRRRLIADHRYILVVPMVVRPNRRYGHRPLEMILIRDRVCRAIWAGSQSVFPINSIIVRPWYYSRDNNEVVEFSALHQNYNI
jgi:hypothetical protein